MLIDMLFGWSFRIAYIDDPLYRAVYYLVLILCGVMSYRKPAYAAYIGIVESTISLLLLILSVWLPVINAPGQVLAEQSTELLSAGQLAGFMLFGMMMAFSIRQSISSLR